ncbi:MAG: nitroreductase family protein [Ignavibacteria bacterium]
MNQSKDSDDMQHREQCFDEIIAFRRSNRSFDQAIEVPDEIIRRALEHAILSPNSSNMQLWEFQWIASQDMLDAFIPLCLDQQAAKTAKHLVVFVTRQDLWKNRAEWNVEKIESAIQGEASTFQKAGINYYRKLMPIMYMRDPFGLMGIFRKTLSFIMGLKGPFFRAGGTAQQRITVHKSCALAAQTFMLSIASAGFHTCPMEGFDEKRVKKTLGLPRKAEINMIIAVGKGTEKGIWGPRFRVPYDEVVRKL